jgi:murein DD-endopeptidase MepM/ murein hydrolase activator NlpD
MAQANKHQKVNIFRIQLVDNETHRKIWGIKFSRMGFIILMASSVLVIFAIVFAIFALTPLKTIIPGYPDSHTKRAAVQNAIRIDSLESVISRWELYSENLVRVVSGETPISLDSIIRIADAASGEAKDADYLNRQDSLLRSEVSSQEQFSLTPSQERKLPIEGMHFFTPLKGVLSEGYESGVHPYVDITAPAGSVVMSVLDGTVVFAGWNDESGYTICIQHQDDIISVYKHNQKLLRKSGDRVTAGSSIALVGSSTETGDHLHFELWYKGEAVDPAVYISF